MAFMAQLYENLGESHSDSNGPPWPTREVKKRHRISIAGVFGLCLVMIWGE